MICIIFVVQKDVDTCCLWINQPCFWHQQFVVFFLADMRRNPLPRFSKQLVFEVSVSVTSEYETEVCTAQTNNQCVLKSQNAFELILIFEWQLPRLFPIALLVGQSYWNEESLDSKYEKETCQTILVLTFSSLWLLFFIFTWVSGCWASGKSLWQNENWSYFMIVFITEQYQMSMFSCQVFIQWKVVGYQKIKNFVQDSLQLTLLWEAEREVVFWRTKAHVWPAFNLNWYVWSDIISTIQQSVSKFFNLNWYVWSDIISTIQQSVSKYILWQNVFIVYQMYDHNVEKLFLWIPWTMENVNWSMIATNVLVIAYKCSPAQSIKMLLTSEANLLESAQIKTYQSNCCVLILNSSQRQKSSNCFTKQRNQ